MKKHDLARLAREEHEDRESVRRKRKKQRGFRKSKAIPRTIRAHRAVENESKTFGSGGAVDA